MGKLAARKPKTIPPLIEGDRMTTDEFFRRYEADKSVVRAELINGVVYVNARREMVNGQEAIVPAISSEGHGKPQFQLSGWLAIYQAKTPGVVGNAPSTVRVVEGLAPEPDALLRILPECGGQSTVGGDGYLIGPPEFIVEIANTTAGRDLGPKLQVYEEAGVKEYLVWRTARKKLDWLVLHRKKFVPLMPDEDGLIRSEMFPGLWLDVPALFAGDLAKVLDVVQLGCASPEHAAFVAKLKSAKRRKK